MESIEFYILLENLKAEGVKHIQEASEICKTCEHLVTIDKVKRCSLCCCPVFYKITGTNLEKSTCPKNKW